MTRFLFGILVLFALTATVGGCADRTAQTPTPVSLDQALRMPPHDLAMGFLSAAEIVSGGAGAMYELYKQSREQGSRLAISTFSHTIHYPDGTSETFNMTMEELEQFVTNNRRLHGTYKKAIMQRGFKQLAPSYHATGSSGCSDRWFSSGEVAVKHTEFVFQVSQAGKAFLGAVVEDTVTVIFPGGFELPMTGKYGKTIELRDVQSKCRVILRARP